MNKADLKAIAAGICQEIADLRADHLALELAVQAIIEACRGNPELEEILDRKHRDVVNHLCSCPVPEETVQRTAAKLVEILSLVRLGR